MTKAYIYARISFDKNADAHGVDSQVKQAKEFAKRHGWEIAGEFVDNDISAYSGKTRPEFERLLEEMDKGNIPILIVWHIDRLGRRTKDLIRVWEAAKKGNTRIETLRAGGIDVSNASGEFTATLLAAIAQYESAHISERIIASQHYRRNNGKYVGAHKPFGYKRGKPGELIIDESEAQWVRKWADRVQNGSSLLSLTREYAESTNDTRAIRVTARNLKRRLLNPVVAGYIQYKGEIVGNGKWEPIITKEQYHICKAILSDPARATTQGRERNFQGSGVYECGVCGKKLRVAKPKNRPNPIYVCFERSCCSAIVPDLDELVESVLFAYLSQPTNQLQVIAKEDNSGEVERLTKELSGLTERQKELGRLFAQGEINSVALKAGNAELQRLVSTATAELSKLREGSEVLDAILSTESLRDRWEKMEPDKRAYVIRSLMEVVVFPAGRGKQPPIRDRVKIKIKS